MSGDDLVMATAIQIRGWVFWDVPCARCQADVATVLFKTDRVCWQCLVEECRPHPIAPDYLALYQASIEANTLLAERYASLTRLLQPVEARLGAKA